MTPWQHRNPLHADEIKVAHDISKLIYVVRIRDMSVSVDDSVEDPVAHALALVQSHPSLIR